MAKLVDSTNQDWQPIRPELTTGVFGKLLLDGPSKIVLTKVEPGGGFHPHRDPYSHLFHIISGRDLVTVETQELKIFAGMSLQVDAGETHAYKNSGQEQLVLISINLVKT